MVLCWVTLLQRLNHSQASMNLAELLEYLLAPHTAIPSSHAVAHSTVCSMLDSPQACTSACQIPSATSPPRDTAMALGSASSGQCCWGSSVHHMQEQKRWAVCVLHVRVLCSAARTGCQVP